MVCNEARLENEGREKTLWQVQRREGEAWLARRLAETKTITNKGVL